MVRAISWIRLIKNKGKIGSCNSELGTTGGNGNINCTPRNRMMKIFWSRINDVKYSNPMVNPDFTAL